MGSFASYNKSENFQPKSEISHWGGISPILHCFGLHPHIC